MSTQPSHRRQEAFLFPSTLSLDDDWCLIDNADEEATIEIGGFLKEETNPMRPLESLKGRVSSTDNVALQTSDSKSSSTFSSTDQLGAEDKLLLEKILTKSFTETSWTVYFGDIGTPPPIPSDLLEIFQNSCPFFKNKTVEDSHQLILIPKTINGKPLTINNLESLLSRPRHWDSSPYSSFIDPANKVLYGDNSIQESYWLLVTSEKIPTHIIAKAPSYTAASLLEQIILESIKSISSAKEKKINTITTLAKRHLPPKRPDSLLKASSSSPPLTAHAARPFCSIENRTLSDIA